VLLPPLPNSSAGSADARGPNCDQTQLPEILVTITCTHAGSSYRELAQLPFLSHVPPLQQIFLPKLNCPLPACSNHSSCGNWPAQLARKLPEHLSRQVGQSLLPFDNSRIRPRGLRKTRPGTMLTPRLPPVSLVRAEITRDSMHEQMIPSESSIQRRKTCHHRNLFKEEEVFISSERSLPSRLRAAWAW
jgi:hypothetical protein